MQRQYHSRVSQNQNIWSSSFMWINYWLNLCLKRKIVEAVDSSGLLNTYYKLTLCTGTSKPGGQGRVLEASLMARSHCTKPGLGQGQGTALEKMGFYILCRTVHTAWDRDWDWEREIWQWVLYPYFQSRSRSWFSLSRSWFRAVWTRHESTIGFLIDLQ